LMGLSNFQRGCLSEEHTYRIGAGATFIRSVLLPLLAGHDSIQDRIPYALEALPDDTIERRLHDLTLDFGIVTGSNLSRPLQSDKLFSWRLRLWVPHAAFGNPKKALRALYERKLPFALASEIPEPLFRLL